MGLKWAGAKGFFFFKTSRLALGQWRWGVTLTAHLPLLPRLRMQAATALTLLHGVSKQFGEWYQKTNKTEGLHKLTLSLGIDRRTAVTRSWIAATSAKRAPFMMLFRQGKRKKSTHRTPLIRRLQGPDQGSTVDFFLFPRLPEEHHERHTFYRRGSNPRTCDSGSAIDS
jgi:hypothetical protein